MHIYSHKRVAGPESAIWAVAAVDGSAVFEIHKLRTRAGAERYHSVREDRATGERTWRSGTRGWDTFEPAARDARFAAGVTE